LRDGINYTGNWKNGCFRQGNRWTAVGISGSDCGSE